MAKITAITAQVKDKNRVNIYVDEEFFRGVSIEIVYKFSLKVGKEVQASKLNEIISIAEEEEALNKALTYITKYSKTKKQLKDYLFKKEYGAQTVYAVIDKLKKYNYLNDVDFARKFIECNSKKQGRKLLEYNLMMKGVCKQDIETAFSSMEIDSGAKAFELAQKHIKNKEKTYENVQKTYKYLISKGFSYEDAGYAVSKLKTFEGQEE